MSGPELVDAKFALLKRLTRVELDALHCGARLPHLGTRVVKAVVADALSRHDQLSLEDFVKMLAGKRGGESSTD